MSQSTIAAARQYEMNTSIAVVTTTICDRGAATSTGRATGSGDVRTLGLSYACAVRGSGGAELARPALVFFAKDREQLGRRRCPHRALAELRVGEQARHP